MCAAMRATARPLRVAVGDGPFQHLHAAHRAADHAEQVGDAEPVDEPGLGAHHVADGDHRKVQPVGAAGGGIDRCRPGRAEAAADDVRADDEIAVGVDRLAGADDGFPPAGLARHRMTAGHVLVAGQRMADQHRVGAIGVQPTIGLIGDVERGEHAAIVERQPLAFGKVGNETRLCRRLGHRR
jgi:hypothetical protein